MIGTSKHQIYTAEDLKTMQAWSLERKIQVTQTRIIEWYTRFNGNVSVSFSGGKDSTVLLDIARRCFPDIEAVYVNTGLEYPELYQFVKTYDNVTVLRPKMNFRQVIKEYGYPLISKRTALNIEYGRRAKELGNEEMYESYIYGKHKDKDTGETYIYMPVAKKYLPLVDSNIPISSKCCSIMKESPLNEYVKTSGKHPIVGIMASESVRRRNAWLKTGCNSFTKGKEMSKPMSFWTEQDVLHYLKKYNIPYANVYGEILKDEDGKYYTTGQKRTGCIFCGFGCQLEKPENRFQILKRTHPKLWEYCMKSWDSGGLGMKEVLEYIGVKIE